MQVLHTSQERLAVVEEKLEEQLQENEALARSNNRMKEAVERMKEKQAVFTEISQIGKELRGFRRQMQKQEELLSITKKENDKLSKEMERMAAAKEEQRWAAVMEQLERAEEKSKLLEKEVEDRKEVIELYRARILEMEGRAARWALAVVAITTLALGAWWGCRRTQ